ncbi:MAG: DNA mismatch endonuclease Vsr [Phycisphaerales bacterium JB039]
MPGVDFLTTDERTRVMRAVTSEGTTPETALQRALRRRRISFQTNATDLPGKPDIVLRRAKVAVFVDGELWHGVQWRRRGLAALEQQFDRAEQRDYWVKKVRRTMRRDLASTAKLIAGGWTVLRLWERDVEANPDAAAQRIGALRVPCEPDPALAAAAGRATLEFFAGIGLMAEGLKREGFTIAYANDNDPAKKALYLHNAPEDGAVFDDRDIHAVQAGDLPASAIATASFPCTDLSLAGAQKGLSRETRSGAYLRFIDLLEDLGDRRPALVLLENVVGLLGSRAGADFEVCLQLLASCGYRLDTFIIDAAHFVPQSRPRLFVVGMLDRLAPPGPWLEPALCAGALRPDRLAGFIAGHASLPWALRPEPPLPRRASALRDLIEDPPDDDPAWFDRARTDKLIGQMSPRHRAEAERMRDSKRYEYGTIFRRMRKGSSMAELRTDGLAGCLRTPRGGSARQMLLRAGKGRFDARLLSARECARLMGAPDFKLAEDAGVNQALWGFGDAVCVDVVAWVARQWLIPALTEMTRGRPIAAVK